MDGVKNPVAVEKPAPPSRLSSGGTPLSPANRVSKGPLDRFLFRGKPAAPEKPKKLSDSHEPEVIVPDTTDCIDISSSPSRTSSSVTNQNVVEETLAEASSPAADSDNGFTLSESDSSQENSGKKSALGVKTEGSAALTLSAQKKRRRLSLDEKQARQAEMERKRAEREKKKEDRERQKQELDNAKKERAEARQKKLDAMKEAEREKEERRKEAEREKEERRKEAEREKEERRKQAEREKEERRKQKDAEKQRKLEEEEAKKSKAAQLFKKHFFIVQSKEPVTKDNDNESADTSYKSFGPWKMFHLRPNQRLGPICRLSREDRQIAKSNLDKALPNQDQSASYLKDIKSGTRKLGSYGPTYPPPEEAVIRLDDNNRATMRAKLLQFSEDIRPPYFGTWRKQSKSISARKPFRQDTGILDYECDSAAEWEEPEDGEDIVSSSKESGEEDTDAAKSSDEEEDGFIVPHGYLSTDEEEAREEEEQANLPPTDLKMKSRIQETYELGFKKIAKGLRPIFFGPELVDSGRPLPIDLSQFQPIFYDPIPADAEAILCGEVTVPDPEPTQPQNPAVSGDAVPTGGDPAGGPSSVKKSKLSTGEAGTAPKIQKKPVPEEGYPALIRYVHGNSAGIGRLIEGFIESFAKEPVIGCDVSKRQVERQIFAIAERTLRPERHPQACWYVREDVQAKYNLKDLPVPNVVHASPAIKRPRKKNDKAASTTSAAADGTIATVPPTTPSFVPLAAAQQGKSASPTHTS